MRRILGVIPARMGSSRFPGKPLARIHGRPMIEHVFRGTAACGSLNEVVVATCDDEIAVAARSFGARAVLTSSGHERATERVAEVSAADDADLIVMVQGDEPLVRPEMIEAAIRPLVDDAGISCVNLAAPIRTVAELEDPNTIKVVHDLAGDALYFSRQAIPHAGRAFVAGAYLKQVCVIAFRRDALARFARLPQAPLEIAESVDMLRFLENAIPVRLARTDIDTHAVDCPADLDIVAAAMTAPAR
jgi:3-deoxy-manno-octulosonate cytidylyltransferase (CMP-KDO synthetase)